MPARRCERNAVAKLHRNRHDVVHRRATRRGAPPCDTLQHGMCCTVMQRRAPTKFAALMDARCSVAHRNALVARTLSGHATRKSCCDMPITGTRLLQHRCATNNDRLLNAQCDIVCWVALQRITPCCNVTITYVEQLETQQHVLQRSHEVRADRPTRANCDAFADDRHGSGDSLAHPHRVAKEPPRSRPTCHRYFHAVPYPLP
jgi:hypothetical protein